MTEFSEEARKRLEAQRLKYLESLNNKRAALSILEEDWNDGQIAVLVDIRHIAHKLAGSAGLYGFDSLAVASRRLDEELRLTSPTDKSVREALDGMIRELDELLGARDD